MGPSAGEEMPSPRHHSKEIKRLVLTDAAAAASACLNPRQIRVKLAAVTLQKISHTAAACSKVPRPETPENHGCQKTYVDLVSVRALRLISKFSPPTPSSQSVNANQGNETTTIEVHKAAQCLLASVPASTAPLVGEAEGKRPWPAAASQGRVKQEFEPLGATSTLKSLHADGHGRASSIPPPATPPALVSNSKRSHVPSHRTSARHGQASHPIQTMK